MQKLFWNFKERLTYFELRGCFELNFWDTVAAFLATGSVAG